MAVASPSLSEAEPADHFARLGLPRRYAISRNMIEDAYLHRAQQVHPDRFVGASASDRRQAMERSAALNEGYRLIRDPVRRAEYLCKLGGIDLDSSDPRGGAPAMGQAFLIEMIERREDVDEARRQGASALDAMRQRVEDEIEDVLDVAIKALEGGQTSEAAAALVQRRYLQRLVDEIDNGSVDG